MIKKYLTEQIRLHPSATPQDVIKHCYQAAFGAEHLLQDPARAFAFLEQEYQALSPAEEPLFEPLSEEVCRINLRAWKREGLPLEWLFRLFTSTTPLQGDLPRLLQEAGELQLFPREEWEATLREYQTAGMPSLHHSEIYRLKEQPAYRLAPRRALRLLPLLKTLLPYREQGCLIAIDGRAASGKSTVAAQLQQILQAEVIHMDDFFLPPALRTPARLSEAGGNVHYERFEEEVLPFLKKNTPFAYRRFDCSQMDFNGTRPIAAAPFRVVEGSYSCHPRFGAYADLTVFCTVDPAEQEQRILLRNGEELLALFRTRWIPMEERYFQAFSVAERADIII